MPKFSPQTPESVHRFLAGRNLAFPESWTLEQVAEESSRRHKSGKWRAPVDCFVAISHWGLYRLSRHAPFKETHWEWLTGNCYYGRDDGYARLGQILSPATGWGAGWRKSSPERYEVVQEVRKAAALILRTMSGAFRLDISLRDVAGANPELAPVADAYFELYEKKMEGHRKVLWTARESGAPLDFSDAPLRGLREPALRDYLIALIDRIDGKLPPARRPPAPKLPDEAEAPDEDSTPEEGTGESVDPSLDEFMDELYGAECAPPLQLDAGGVFGAYPKRKDALQRAVILAFPRAVFERSGAPPKSSLAAVIEEACIAWFGNSRTQKEINTLIRDQRAENEKRLTEELAMRARVREVEQSAMAKLRGAVDSSGQPMSETLRSFLDLE